MKRSRYKAGDPHPEESNKVFWRQCRGRNYWETPAERETRLEIRRNRRAAAGSKTRGPRLQITASTRAKDAIVALKKDNDPWVRGDVNPETGKLFWDYLKKGGRITERWVTEKRYGELKIKARKAIKRYLADPEKRALADARSVAYDRSPIGKEVKRIVPSRMVFHPTRYKAGEL